MSLVQFLKSKVFGKQLLVALAAFLVFSFLVISWLKIATNHNQKIEVPNLVKMSIEDVENSLEEYDLEYVVIDSVNYDPNFPPQSVISQSPEAGDFVKENRKIYLKLNPSSYSIIEMPDLMGRTKRQAISQLMAIGFRVDEKYEYIPDIAEDVVRGIKWNGSAVFKGSKVPKNSILTLVLGDGYPDGGNPNNVKEEEIIEEIEF